MSPLGSKSAFVLGAISVALVGVGPAAAQSSHTDNSNRTDAVSTGVGNAGSHATGNGTADSISTGNGTSDSISESSAHATSDGMHDSSIVDTSTYNTGHYSNTSGNTLTFKGPMSLQELNATVTENSTHFDDGGFNSGQGYLSNGSGLFAGTQTASLNTGSSSSSQAATSIAASGDVRFAN